MKRLESEIKIMNEKMHMEARGKMSEHGSLEKRVQEFVENEKRLYNEIEDLKNERDRRNQELQR